MNNHLPKSSAALRTAIITGGNSGLGYACARTLLENVSGEPPWNVVLACRDPARAQEAVERLREFARVAGTTATSTVR